MVIAEPVRRGESVVSERNGRRAMGIVQATDRASVARSVSAAPAATPLPIPVRDSMPPPSLRPPLPQNRPPTARPSSASAARAREPLFLPSSQPSEAEGELRLPARDEEPLFLPGTQLSPALRESGLGLESMTAREFAAMLEGDAEEVDFGSEPSLEIVDGEGDVEMELAPTQPGGGAKVRAGSQVCVLPEQNLTGAYSGLADVQTALRRLKGRPDPEGCLRWAVRMCSFYARAPCVVSLGNAGGLCRRGLPSKSGASSNENPGYTNWSSLDLPTPASSYLPRFLPETSRRHTRTRTIHADGCNTHCPTHALA